MTDKNQIEWFSKIDSIINDPLKFKIKLAIGENAYKELRIKKAAWEVWDISNVATGPVQIAALATTWFGVSATPIGWLVLAGVLSSGAYIGITRYLKSKDQDRVDVIPKFINTPLDVLALGLFDLLAPLALKVANVDGTIDKAERRAISDYFINEWGYDQSFVTEGIAFAEDKLAEFTIKELAQTLAEFKKINPDCNYSSMSKEIVSFLQAVIESDGRIDEREEMAIERINKIFYEVGQINFKEIAKDGYGAFRVAATDAGQAIKATTGKALEKTGDLTSGAYTVVKEQGEKTVELVSEACDTAITHGKKLFSDLKTKVQNKG
jgi:uncharacterized tellurite resistance protein B-like protein